VNVMMLLEMARDAFGERLAFTDGASGRSLTYEALFDAARRRAATIAETGASRVAALDVTSLASPVALFASAWAGVPYVPLNYRLTDPEIVALLERIRPAYLVTSAERHANFHGNHGVQASSRERFLDDTAHARETDAEWPMDPDAIAVLLFTSGTTGAAKAAVLRHKHLVSYILGAVDFASADPDEATLVSVPPYHVAGIAAMLSSVYSGRRVVQLPQFSADAWLDVARDERITSAFVVPTMLMRIVDSLSGREADLPHLTSISYGGGKMPLPVIEAAMRAFPNVDFANAYGLTETSSTIAVLGPDDHREAAASGDALVRRRLASVGRPLPSVEIEVRGPDREKLGSFERGEIYVRGEQVSGEYQGRGATLDDEGWFATRDAGYLDAAGFLFLDGRADDVIVRGGENLSPGEIEDVLREHPAVADVAVVGVPDTEWGEAVAAAIVRRADVTADALRDWVKSRLRSSRVPGVIEWWDELPYNETGKLLRRVVRDRLAR
jgi:long-chain acyl-CoA synthetase